MGMLRRSMFKGQLSALELIHDANDVGAGFAEGRDAMIAVDGGGTGVVGGEREGQTVRVVVGVVAVEELIEVGGAAGDVLVGTECVVHAELLGGAGHELHEAAGSSTGEGVGTSTAFGADDAGEEGSVDVVLSAGCGNELGDAGSCDCGRGCRRERGLGRVGKGF